MPSLIYLGIHGLLTIFFALRIVRLRWKHRVSLGHGEQRELMVATRVFGNHNEYSPLFLILLFALDFQSPSRPLLIHSLGIAFTLGRIAHAVGLTGKHGVSAGRTIGMVVTFICIAILSIILIGRSANLFYP